MNHRSVQGGGSDRNGVGRGLRIDLAVWRPLLTLTREFVGRWWSLRGNEKRGIGVREQRGLLKGILL